MVKKQNKDSIEEKYHLVVEYNPAIVPFFQGKTLIKHEFRVKNKAIDFVIVDAEFHYLVEMKYQCSPIEAIVDIDRKAPLYSIQEGVDPQRIKEVVLCDKKSYQKKKDEVEFWEKSRRDLIILTYDPQNFEEVSIQSRLKTSEIASPELPQFSDRYVSTSKAAQLLGTTRVTIFRRIKKGHIIAKKVGRSYAVDKWSLGIKYHNLAPLNKRSPQNSRKSRPRH